MFVPFIYSATMKIPFITLILSWLVFFSGIADARVWRDTFGHSVDAEYVRMSGESVHLRRSSDKQIIQVNFGILSPKDQAFLGERASGSKSFKIRAAVSRVDAALEAGLAKNKLKYNEPLNDHMFVRRLYADLAGRIPTYEELTGFLSSRNSAKRSDLVEKLLSSEDFVSHNFNYFADLLRIQSKIPGTVLRTDAFIHWFKEQIRKNRPFDDLVEEMITAEGRIWENPAAAYHLRDNGMKLDHVSYMTKVFLGTDISCAQCHDDPFQDWTQYEYYQLSSFLGDLETKKSLSPPRGKGKKGPKGPRYELNRNALYKYLGEKNGIDITTEEGKLKVRRLSGRFNRAYREIKSANELVVYTRKNQPLRLPDDYQYDDFKPKEIVKPRAIFGQEPGGQVPPSTRQRLATWLVSQHNPRFASNIANRMWARFFGRGVVEPLYNFIPEDDEGSENAYNTQLLDTLSEVMLELDFDLRAFTRVIVRTKAYNTLSTRRTVSGADPYFFPGPILRRMSAEQIWDSLLTLMIENPSAYRAGKGDAYTEIINLLATGPQNVETLIQRINKYRSYKPLSNLFDNKGKSYLGATNQPRKKVVPKKPNPAGNKSSGNPIARINSQNSPSMNPNMAMQDMSMMMNTARRSNVTLVRASEFSQPAPAGHFLNKFGQSERNFVVGAVSDEGSVPQVMELMNGAATMVLTKPDSLIFKKMKNESNPMRRAEIVFLSILNRQILAEERDMLVKELEKGDKAMPNLIWALLNTPEFIFIK